MQETTRSRRIGFLVFPGCEIIGLGDLTTIEAALRGGFSLRHRHSGCLIEYPLTTIDDGSKASVALQTI